VLTSSRHAATLDVGRSAVVVIDVQEAFRGYVPDLESIAANIRLLLAGAGTCHVPVAASEQYPQGLGATVEEVGLPEGVPVVEKLEFAVCAAPGWAELPTEIRDASQFVLVGIEAHVCVRHTALALLGAGREVHVAVDAVASHTAEHRDVSLRSLEQADARLTTVEQVLFDWLGAAGTPAFRRVQELVVEHSAGR
jgi:nicotinamidase-related amidase